MKQIAKQRIERAVYRIQDWHDQQSSASYEAWAMKLILAERARLKRGVQKLYTHEPNFRGGMVPCEEGQWVKLADILTLWEG